MWLGYLLEMEPSAQWSTKSKVFKSDDTRSNMWNDIHRQQELTLIR